VGDNFGHVHLIDISRKQILDKLEIDEFKGRRILNVSTCTLEWIDTRLTYAAIIARGSPIINVVVFKHNENKMYKIYSINCCPELENPLHLEQNDKQTYNMLPCNSMFSMDGEFLHTTSYDGRVRVVKMPPIIDPISNEGKETTTENPPAGINTNSASNIQHQSRTYLGSGSEEYLQGVTIKGELEGIVKSDLQLSDIMIADVPPLEKDNFEDPFKSVPPPLPVSEK
jgi:hypothetical protein